NIFSRESILFYRKRRYVCGCCKKRFYEKNELVDRYQRQSKEFKQSIALELIHGKSFKDVADRFNTSTSTVIRRFDTINENMMIETIQLLSVIVIDEYKDDARRAKYQTNIDDSVDRWPLDTLPARRKLTVQKYLKQHGVNVNIVVMEMSPSF